MLQVNTVSTDNRSDLKFEGKTFSVDYLTKFSICCDGFWIAVETC